MWVKDNRNPLTEKDMEVIANYMDDALREQLHQELAPCSPTKFVDAYVQAEPDFEDVLNNELNISDNYWYAVVTEGDNDWGDGSYDYDEAKKRALDYSMDEDSQQYIAVINDGSDGTADPICVREIHFSDEELGFIPVQVSGEIKKMTYAAVCHRLGFDASVSFVDVKEDGKIGFTCGKEHECRSLMQAIRKNQMVPTDGLFEAAYGRKMRVTDRADYIYRGKPAAAQSEQPATVEKAPSSITISGYEFRACTAVSTDSGDPARQKAIFCHCMSDEFNDGDAVIFGYGHDLPADEDDVAMLFGDTAAWERSYETLETVEFPEDRQKEAGGAKVDAPKASTVKKKEDHSL
jgi:hypothetical protein